MHQLFPCNTILNIQIKFFTLVSLFLRDKLEIGTSLSHTASLSLQTTLGWNNQRQMSNKYSHKIFELKLILEKQKFLYQTEFSNCLCHDGALIKTPLLPGQWSKFWPRLPGGFLSVSSVSLVMGPFCHENKLTSKILNICYVFSSLLFYFIHFYFNKIIFYI